MTELKQKPKTASQQELDKIEKQFIAFDENIKDMTLDRLSQTAKEETESTVKLSQKDIEKSREVYLKPNRTIASKERFNEDFREEYNFQKEYVNFIAENKEIIGETIEMWTKPFPGIPAEEWKVPTGKPVWGPRYLAEQITKAKYHRFVMQQNQTTGADGMGQYYGAMAVDTTIQRLDAIPVNGRKSVFMSSR